MEKCFVKWVGALALLFTVMAHAQAWKFAVICDSRGGDVGVNSSILGEIATALTTEGIDLVIVPGDMVGNGGNDQYVRWKEVMAPVYNAGINVYPVRGNHENYSGTAGWVENFGADIPDNGPVGEVDYTYAVNHNNTLFIATDQYITDQKHRVNQAWVDQQLASTSATHVFAFGHEPAFKAGHADCLDDYPTERDAFWSSLAGAGCRAYFCGHDHNLDILRADDGDGNPSNDIWQYLVGTAGAPLYSEGVYDGNNGSYTPIRETFQKVYGYTIVEVDGTAATLTFKKRTGTNTFVADHTLSYDHSGEQPPVTVADKYYGVESQIVSVAAPGILANDQSPYGRTLTPSIVTAPVNGSLTLNNDGSFTYIPNGPFTGTDTFEYTVDDAGITGNTVTVTLNMLPKSGSVATAIQSGNDDVEERVSDGNMYLGSSDLEIVSDLATVGGDQVIGLRFTGVEIPANATVTSAYVQFTTDEVNSDVTNLIIKGEQSADAGVFTATNYDVSSRTATTARVNWSPAAWTTVNEAGEAQQTPELNTILNEIVSINGWEPGNALVLSISGTGKRVADSYNGGAAKAPVLNLSYTVDSANNAPVAVNDSYTLDTAGSLTVSATGVLANDTDETPASLTVVTYNQPTNGSVVLNSDGSFTYTPNAGFIGSDSFTYQSYDGTYVSSAATVSIDVLKFDGTVVNAVSAGADDVEERVSDGNMYLNSSDLEIVSDLGYAGGDQIIGLRFTNLQIPANATVTSAYVQFNTDEVNSDVTNLVIKGEQSANAGAFTTIKYDVSSRTSTSASVNWTPDAWTTVNEAGPAQQTPDLSSIVEEVIGLQGWSSGNAMVLTISGSGKRVADSYNGGAAKAPKLNITYKVIADGYTEVPSIAGLTQVNAEMAIVNSQLSVGTVTEAYSDTVAAGVVTSQSIVAGTAKAVDSVVDFVVSKGPNPVTTTVPDVIGLTETVADTALIDATLVKGAVGEAYSETIEIGKVTAQSLTAGSTVSVNSAVDLTLSDGPLPATHWKLDETSGTVAADSVNNADGIVSGAVWVDGKKGKALQFDGVDDKVMCGTAPSLSGQIDFTVSAWIKTSSATSQVIIQQRDAQGYNGEYQMKVNSNGTIGFMLYRNGYQYSFSTTATVADGQWHHVAFVRQGDSGEIFIDGTSAATATGTVRDLVATIGVGIGADIRDNNKFFNGMIDEVRIYSRALSAIEVLVLANPAN